MLAGLLTGHAFLQVWVTSTSLTHRAHTDSDQDVTMETKLEGEVNIITAKTLVTPSMILCSYPFPCHWLVVPYSTVLAEEVADTNFVKIARIHPLAASVDGTLFVESLDIVCTCSCPDGSLLCCAGCQGGLVKVFCLSVSLCWGSEFTVTSTLATEFRPTNNPSGAHSLTHTHTHTHTLTHTSLHILALLHDKACMHSCLPLSLSHLSP